MRVKWSPSLISGFELPIMCANQLANLLPLFLLCTDKLCDKDPVI